MDPLGAQATEGIPRFAPFQPGDKAAAIVRAFLVIFVFVSQDLT
jgi:hypothetical protein